MEHVGHCPRALCYITLDSVRERVHTRRGGQALGHGAHHIAIDYGNNGYVVDVHTNKLTTFLRVGNYVVYSNFRRSSRSSGHCYNGHARIFSGCDAFERTHVGVFGVGHDNAYRFCGVHGRPAADCYNVIRAALFACGNARLHVLDSRIGFDVAVKFVFELCAVQNVEHLLRHAELNEIGVGANERFFKAAALRLARDFLDTSRAVITCFVQNNSCHNK